MDPTPPRKNQPSTVLPSALLLREGEPHTSQGRAPPIPPESRLPGPAVLWEKEEQCSRQTAHGRLWSTASTTVLQSTIMGDCAVCFQCKCVCAVCLRIQCLICIMCKFVCYIMQELRVHQCAIMCTNVHQCVICKCAPICTNVQQCAPMCKSPMSDVQQCANLHQCAPMSNVHQCAPEGMIIPPHSVMARAMLLLKSSSEAVPQAQDNVTCKS